MILVDTSIWVDHLRHGDDRLAALLAENMVLAHPYVIGELALGSNCASATASCDCCGAFRGRPSPATTRCFTLIEQETLSGIGIGYIDAHLLAATRLTVDAMFWTRDRRLLAAAEKAFVGRALISIEPRPYTARSISRVARTAGGPKGP